MYMLGVEPEEQGLEIVAIENKSYVKKRYETGNNGITHTTHKVVSAG